MARQGTVHLWEDEDHNSIAICHGGAISSDAFLRTATSSEAATTASPEMMATSGISDDAVLYCD